MSLVSSRLARGSLSTPLSSIRPTRRLRGTLAALLTATAVSLAPAGAQCLPRLPFGDAWRSLRGPSLSFTALVAADGTSEARFVLDQDTPGVRTRIRFSRGGLRFTFEATLSSPGLGSFDATGEVDVCCLQTAPLSWDLDGRVTLSRQDLAVSRIGFEVTHKDEPGEQAWLVPVFSGGEFVEPFDSIPVGDPVDTGIGNSMQCTAYYSADGSGLLMYALDPRGTIPKRFTYASGREGNPEIKTIRATMDYVLPNANVGGQTAETLSKTRIVYYYSCPDVAPGWYEAAKIYRHWLRCNATGCGQILEQGRLETRTDTPDWMRNIDLLINEQYGWYPAIAQDQLLNLVRLKADLQATNVVTALFFWWDRASPLGLAGSYYPLPGTVNQVSLLKTLGIHTIGYTNPGVFDTNNPFFLAKSLDTEISETRTGAPLFLGPEVSMDLTSTKLADHWQDIAAYHATSSSMSGFFCDAPAQAGIPDWKRPTGQNVGVTEEAYLGYKDLLARMQAGARSANKDFVNSHEAAFEWLIPVANFGQGAVGVIGRAYKDEARTRGVPFFQTVYSGYTLFWPAEEGLGWQTILFTPDPFGDLTKNAISRLMAEGVTWGGIPNHSEFVLYTGLIYNELPLPPPILAAFVHHGNLTRNCIALRQRARPWLVFGELLNSPAVGGDMVDVIVKRPFDNIFYDQTFEKFAVPTQAWRAKDGSIRVISINGGTSAANVELDLRRIGLRTRTLVDVDTNEEFTADRRTGIITVTVQGGAGRILAPAGGC
ncbi:MAG: hypothetical protein KDC95_14065 [Planctomycetes bacterium]|nr:hypothetical protein [Planctomycetota bacterium]